MNSFGNAVDLGTDALSMRFPEGVNGVDPELVSATVIDAAWVGLNNIFWEVHRPELERLLLKNERLLRVYRTAKVHLATKGDASVISERLQKAIEDFEYHYAGLEPPSPSG